jgi:hypothetical protein
MPMSEAAKEKMRKNKRDENGNVKPEIYERLKKAHEVQREKKRQRREQRERARELEKLKQEAEEARKKREIEDLKREIAATDASAKNDGARADPELGNELPRQTGRGDEEGEGRAPAQAADPAQHGHHTGEKPAAPDGGRGEEIRGEESTPQAAPRSHEPPQPGGVRERGPDGDGLDSVGAVDKRTKDKIAAYAFPNASIPAPSTSKPAQPAQPAAKRSLPVNRVII